MLAEFDELPFGWRVQMDCGGHVPGRHQMHAHRGREIGAVHRFSIGRLQHQQDAAREPVHLVARGLQHDQYEPAGLNCQQYRRREQRHSAE